MAGTQADTLPGPRKVAILMVLLGQEVAGPLLQRLPREFVAEIAGEVSRIGAIEPELAQSVLEDYFVDAIRPIPPRGGAELAAQLLASASIPEAARHEILGTSPPDPAKELLAPLLDAPAEVLTSVLADEHPQTVALVLLTLRPDRAAKVLEGMPEETRSGAVKRMSVLRTVRGEVLDAVAASLQERLGTTELPSGDGGDPLERTAAVLQQMKRNEVRALLEALEETDPERATKLREMVYTFDSLLFADDRGIQELLRMVESKTLALALREAEPSLREKFIGNLSERAGAMLQEEIEFLGTVRPSDRQMAEREIVDQALKLEQEEKLVFNEPGEEGDS